MKNVENFAVSFLQDIHFRVQKFFFACTQATDIESIDFRFIDFSRLLDDIEMHCYHISIPNWYRLALLEKNKKNGKSGKGRDRENDRFFNSNKKQLVENKKIDAICKLKPTEYLNKVFSKMTIKDLSVPKHNNEDICLKYHCLGKCDSGCPCRGSHTELKGDTLISFCAFVKAAKAKFYDKKDSSATSTSQSNEEDKDDSGEEK